MIRKIIFKILKKIIPKLEVLEGNVVVSRITDVNNDISNKAKLFKPYSIKNSSIGKYTYIAHESQIYNTSIGKFCSIGPNFMSGMGKHPVNGISTAPMFYSSTNLCNGITLCSESKFVENEPIVIGNDVFIGANVIILDGVSVGDGAIIGAGSVVTKNITDYAIVGGVPAKVIKYRFSKEQINKLINIEWWNWDDEKLKDVEKYFYDLDLFIQKNTYHD